MWKASFAVVAALAASSHADIQYTELLPTASPTATIDAWQCYTENITQYFDFPRPTGTLLDAMTSYGKKLYAPCTDAGTLFFDCPFPGTSLCGFATAAPSTVVPAYSSYASSAASWWSAKSASAVALATECPVSWYHAMNGVVGGDQWLNETIAYAGCYAGAHPAAGGSGATTTSGAAGPPATPGSGVAKTSGPTATATPPPNRATGRGEGLGMWMVGGTGLAAAAANAW
jgi:hypothetical protein